jgi:hypothetical protein
MDIHPATFIFVVLQYQHNFQRNRMSIGCSEAESKSRFQKEMTTSLPSFRFYFIGFAMPRNLPFGLNSNWNSLITALKIE